MTEEITIEMNFCRRCGSALTRVNDHVYKCANMHVIFANCSPAVGVAVLNDQGEVLVLERAIDPGKGMLDLPGGFLDGMELPEDAAVREMQEEVNLGAGDYSTLELICSGLDPYDYKGEVLPVMTLMYKATIKPGAVIKADDDAATAEFMSLASLDVSKFQFPSIQKAILDLQSKI